MPVTPKVSISCNQATQRTRANRAKPSSGFLASAGKCLVFGVLQSCGLLEKLLAPFGWYRRRSLDPSQDNKENEQELGGVRRRECAVSNHGATH